MPKPSKGPKFYAVQDGRETGVFTTWEECERQTKGYPGAKYKSFSNAANAEAFVSGMPLTASASASTSKATSLSITHTNPDNKGKKRAMPQDIEDESSWDVVYSDGACKGNGKLGSVAGVGVWWGEGDPRNIAERCPGDQTNNRAELIAIIRVLETTPRSKTPLLIKTDSQYCINCFYTWLPQWKKNNFKTSSGGAVKNLGVIRYLAALLEARGLLGQRVHLQYVKGHSGDRGNDGADAQANLGALLAPAPERDWEKAEREVKAKADVERRESVDKPPIVPLQVSRAETPNALEAPRKLRKVSKELPFSRIPSATAKASPTRAIHTAAADLSPPPLDTPRTEYSTTSRLSSPPSPTKAPTPKVSSRASAAERKSTHKPDRHHPSATAVSVSRASTLPATPTKPTAAHASNYFNSSTRLDGGDYLIKSPSTPRRVKEFYPLPSASEYAKAQREARSPQPAKIMAMSVNKEDINFEDYVDGWEDGDDNISD